MKKEIKQQIQNLTSSRLKWITIILNILTCWMFATSILLYPLLFTTSFLFLISVFILVIIAFILMIYLTFQYHKEKKELQKILLYIVNILIC